MLHEYEVPTFSNIQSKIHKNTEKFYSYIYIHKLPLLMPLQLFCSHYRQLWYDTVVTATLDWHHRRWVMKSVTAQESQNKLLPPQQSATLHNVAFQTAVKEIYRVIILLTLFTIQHHVKFGWTILFWMDSSVGIATLSGLERTGIESRQGRVFCTSHTGSVTHTDSNRRGTGWLPGVNAFGAWCWRHTSSTPRLKRECSYIYAPFWPCGLFWGKPYYFE
jgi:hypothetical protein